MTLVELLIATAIGALLLAGLTSVARQGVQSRAMTRDNDEAIYQARFALQRMAAAARATAPHTLLPPAANTSGNWFDPAYFCLNAASALIETTTTDAGCTGTRVIAERVSGLAATQPVGAGALETMTAVVALSLDVPASGTPLTLSERVRLGGGVK
ncbi:MAG: hypothetical protein IPH26_06695 [Sterolibacteriaceae bacterium]|uniref:Prepilin-type N-terminal cleavage/methylation domain-containing protein n=1 Tax=Candidatus Methylophosphatis roskildensis TaxID=2899263 RepID=A0A9D7E2R0_9PROT|nr:hypothetical protein [Candidatus Methylophosphatis roskildensis]